MNLDDIAARLKRGEAITLDEHRALTAGRRVPDPYRKVGRGSARHRKWDSQQSWAGDSRRAA